MNADAATPVKEMWDINGPLPFHCRKCGKLIDENRKVVLTGKPHECDVRELWYCNPVPAEHFK